MFASLTRLPRTTRTTAVAAAVALTCTLVPVNPALAGAGFVTTPVTQSSAMDPVEARFENLMDRVLHLQLSAFQVVGRPIVVDRDNLPGVLSDIGSRSDAEAAVVVRLMQQEAEAIQFGCIDGEPACQRLVTLADAITSLENHYIAQFGHTIPVNDETTAEVARQVDAKGAELTFVLRTLQLRESIEQWRSAAQVTGDTLG